MKKTFTLLLFILSLNCFSQENWKLNFPKLEEKASEIPNKSKVWVFIMAGQSNMAGRGFVEPQDTLSQDRILSINSKSEIILAKEPLHWYEPNSTGLDCGLSFAQNLLLEIPQDVSILMLPVAIGGSSTTQWLGDSTYRGVQLLTNFKEKVAIGKKYGTIKGIIWHQGESDANGRSLPQYSTRMETLLKQFRKETGNKKLPIIMGELGGYRQSENWLELNDKIRNLSSKDKYTGFITTKDLNHKGDNLHFNSEGLREIGKRFAEKYISIIK
ncbi:sialate O-acetylesterase [Arcticibacterium luteifluviistationis]|uniref:Sialate O-acetylesterase n=1 Tax=Arcticibacterium luteifluviistationis TaxID=1784714 RepID=A0A2Z4GD09_9BACT|nr:sialate O-acetylesterase [Arcticibacterium luteifluviistationis]AWV98968.1 sialate O-acetylesterase [Arcticibacterium luteifluviistationis]